MFWKKYGRVKLVAKITFTQIDGQSVCLFRQFGRKIAEVPITLYV
jgi:hypothetical protein